MQNDGSSTFGKLPNESNCNNTPCKLKNFKNQI